MSQHYSDPARESDPWSLPDVEVFYMAAEDFLHADDSTWMFERMAEAANAEAVDFRNTSDDKIDAAVRAAAAEAAGWYYWYCLPGCLPDSEPNGPYATEQEAIDAAREENN